MSGRTSTEAAALPPPSRQLTVTRYKTTRFWAVREPPEGTLVCICVYKRGAQAVVERLTRVTRFTRVARLPRRQRRVRRCPRRGSQ
jgi:hypothetical protein